VKKWKKTKRFRRKKTILVKFTLNFDNLEQKEALNNWRIAHNMSWQKLVTTAIRKQIREAKNGTNG